MEATEHWDGDPAEFQEQENGLEQLSLFYSLISINEALFTEDAIRDTIEYVRLAASGVER